MRFHRKTSPKVKGGKVQRNNRWRKEPDYTPTRQVKIERYKPRHGFRHFVSPADVTAFLGLLPNWRELAVGLHRVVLSPDTTCQGWFFPGTVAVCAWEEECFQLFHPGFYAEHANLLHRLRVPCHPVTLVKSCPDCDLGVERARDWAAEPICVNCGSKWYPFSRDTLQDEYEDFTYFDVKVNRSKEATPRAFGYVAEFTPATVQAFLLIHVLIHELGHHHDCMTSPKQRFTPRGERFAEEYAQRHEAVIWSGYCRAFRFTPGRP